VFTTSGTYPWSFVTQIFHNGQPSRGGDRKTFEVMTIALSVKRSLEDPEIESGFSSLRDDLSEKVCLLMIEGCCLWTRL
jgi:hypothetical protein